MNLSFLDKDDDFDAGLGFVVASGEKNRSSVCHRGISNSVDPWVARTVNQ